jgi:hypothetical protein
MKPSHSLLPVFLWACLLLCFSASHAQSAFDEKHLQVSLRMIGHQVLLSSGDSSSRVLPIVEREGQYRIRFESEFEFEPEVLLATVDRVVKETELAGAYILEVEACETGEVVYGFEMSEADSSRHPPLPGQEATPFLLQFGLYPKGSREARRPRKA